MSALDLDLPDQRRQTVTPDMLRPRDRAAIVVVSVGLLAASGLLISRTARSGLTAASLLTLALLVLAALVVVQPHASYGGRRGTAVEMNAQGVIHLAGLVLLPTVALPVLLCTTFLGPRRSKLWHLWNFAAHTASLVAAAWAYRSLGASVADAAGLRFPLPGGSAVLSAACAVVVYWLVETTTYTWLQWVVAHQSPAETDMWAPMAILFDVCLLSVGALIGVAVSNDPWMALLAVPALVLVALGIVALDRTSQAQYDMKTGLLTLPAFQAWAARDLVQATRRGSAVSVVMLDLDRFRRVNSEHGHLAGDSVLKHVAALVSADRRVTDLVARYGGEELVLLLPDADVDDAARIAEEIRSRLAGTSIALGDGDLTVTASFGVAEALPGESLDDLVNRADRALYAAKRAGRNQVHVAERAGAAERSRPA